MNLPASRLGRYRLLRRLGVGGMAEVFEAELEGEEGAARRLAVKVLLPGARREQELVHAFIDEARIASELHHPNIVEVYDFGESEGGHYLVMELVDGWDLREVQRRLGARGGRLTPEAAAYIVHEVSRALHYIHTRERAIVHRDVSPHNVFVTREGQIKLGDFGVAKTSARLARTLSGQIKGKLAYLAPEQVSGDPVSGRTDVYAAGLLLFELLTGRRYIQGEREIDLLRAAQNPHRTRPSQLVRDAAPLDATVAAALEPHPAMRTRDAALLAEQLAAFLATRPFGASELAALCAELEAAAGSGGRQAATAEATTAGSPRSPRRTLELPEVPGAERPPRGWPRRWKLATLGAVASALLAWGALLALRPGLLSGSSPPPDASTRSGRDASARPGRDASARSGRDASTRPLRDAEVLARDAGRSVRRVPALTPAKVLRARVHALPDERAPGPAAKVAAPVSVADTKAREAARQRFDELAERARARGLFPGDDPGHDRARARVKAAIARGEEIEPALRALSLAVDGFRIDPAFIKRKLGRLEALLARPELAEAERKRLTLASQRILKLVLGGQLVEASRQITSALNGR